MFKVDNAIIMAAGTSSRFAPLSYEKPKGLVEVKGEILVERQIRQLREAGIEDIVLITGYKAEMYDYLKEKFHITLVHNPDYLVRNNNSSIQSLNDLPSKTCISSSFKKFFSYATLFHESSTMTFPKSSPVQ